MDDITKKYEFQEILRDAAQYRMLRQIFESDRRDRIPEERLEKTGLAPERLRNSGAA